MLAPVARNLKKKKKKDRFAAIDCRNDKIDETYVHKLVR